MSHKSDCNTVLFNGTMGEVCDCGEGLSPEQRIEALQDQRDALLAAAKAALTLIQGYAIESQPETRTKVIEPVWKQLRAAIAAAESNQVVSAT